MSLTLHKLLLGLSGSLDQSATRIRTRRPETQSISGRILSRVGRSFYSAGRTRDINLCNAFCPNLSTGAAGGKAAISNQQLVKATTRQERQQSFFWVRHAYGVSDGSNKTLAMGICVREYGRYVHVNNRSGRSQLTPEFLQLSATLGERPMSYA